MNKKRKLILQRIRQKRGAFSRKKKKRILLKKNILKLNNPKRKKVQYIPMKLKLPPKKIKITTPEQLASSLSSLSSENSHSKYKKESFFSKLKQKIKL